MLKVDNLRVDQTNKNRITRLKRKLVDIGLPKPSIGQDWIKARYVLSLIMLRESDSLYFIPPIR